MALIAVQTVDDLGADLTLSTAAAGGDTFANDGRTSFIVQNGSGAAITVTLTAQNTTTTLPGGTTATIANRSKSIAAGSVGIFDALPPAFFNNASGQVAVTYSGVTSLKVAAVRLSNRT